MSTWTDWRDKRENNEAATGPWLTSEIRRLQGGVAVDWLTSLRRFTASAPLSSRTGKGLWDFSSFIPSVSYFTLGLPFWALRSPPAPWESRGQGSGRVILPAAPSPLALPPRLADPGFQAGEEGRTSLPVLPRREEFCARSRVELPPPWGIPRTPVAWLTCPTYEAWPQLFISLCQ